MKDNLKYKKNAKQIKCESNKIKKNNKNEMNKSIHRIIVTMHYQKKKNM